MGARKATERSFTLDTAPPPKKKTTRPAIGATGFDAPLSDTDFVPPAAPANALKTRPHEAGHHREGSQMSNDIRMQVELDLSALGDVPPAGKGYAYGPAALGRARDLALFVDRRFAPSGEAGNRLPGLSDGKLAADTSARIRFLVGEVEGINVALGAIKPKVQVRAARAQANEVREFLKWIARGDEALSDQLGAIAPKLKRARGTAAVVTVVSELVVMATPYAARLADLPAFPPTLLDDARALIRAHDDSATDRAAELRRRRTGLLILLKRTLQDVVAVAKMVFRHYPALAREIHVGPPRRHVAKAEALPQPSP
jgi:hypothetical protein